ncbi:MAG: hypothetical protein B6D59_05670 [Campylobacteraceae bacterium 4484_4]|nr:MAG: hypothetical protein B6D59_05670 [Campylobacteraceae bacterium 4484_4]
MKIRRNVQLLTILPISLLIIAGGYLFWSSYQHYKTAALEERRLQESELSKTLYLNLLRESGATTLYALESREDIKKLLQNQRHQSDIARTAYLDYFTSTKSSTENRVIKRLGKLDALRKSYMENPESFSTLNRYLLETSELLFKEIKRRLIDTPPLHHAYLDILERMKLMTKEQNYGLLRISDTEKPILPLLQELFQQAKITPLFSSLSPEVKKSVDPLLQEKSFVETLQKSDSLKRAMLSDTYIPAPGDIITWYRLETRKIGKLNQISDMLYTSMLKEVQKEATTATVGMTISLLLLLFSLYLLYLYSKMQTHFFDTRGLERLLDKIIKNALLEDTIDLDSTEGIEKTYRVIEETVDKIEKEKRKAERANAAKSIFLANMSHEIRTPINGIIGFTDLLKNSDLGKNEREYVNIITKSTDNLLEIINNILDLSKIESKKIEIDEIIFSPVIEFESAVDVYTPNAASKKINYSLYISPDFENFLVGDPIKIKEVLQNLISNALKFTPEGGQVSVVIRKEEAKNPSNERIYFEVSDTGIGMSEEEMEDIFNAFSQADSTITRKYGGTGLGLTISYNYVSLMGGKLEVESQKGVGSNFYFTLELPKEKPMKMLYKERFAGIRAAIVSDDPQHDKLASHLQETLGYLCKEARIITSEAVINEKKHDENLIVTQSSLLDSKMKKELKALGKPLLLITPTSEFHTDSTEEDEKIVTIYEPLSFTRMTKTLEEIERRFKLKAKTKHVTSTKEQKESVTVLVAEDNEINQKLMETILKRLNVDIRLARNGQEAVVLFKKEPFDLVLMDIAMPVMDGLSATKEILAYEEEHKRPHTPIVALTANALKGDKERYLNEGMDTYLAKPAREEDVKNILLQYGLLPEKEESKETKTGEIEEKAGEAERLEQEHKSPKPTAILIFKKSKVETKIFEKVLRQIYDEVESAKNSDDFFHKIQNRDYRVIMVDKEIPDLDLNLLAESIEDRSKTALLLFRAFDTIIDDRTKAIFDEVLINSADKVYLKLALQEYLKLKEG